MSVLGYFDILNELGKNILIYPMNNIIIKNSSIDLSASKYAWSLTTKKSLVKNNKITIPANDTAIILTNESIYVSEKICGTYHPKVSLVSKGLSHISTTLDPNFIGISVISIHNNSTEEITIPVNLPFVSIMFYYVNSRSKSNTHYSSKEFIASFNDFEGYPQLSTWLTKNNWIFEDKDLREKMIDSSAYKVERNKIKYKNKISFILRHSLFMPIVLLTILIISSVLLILLNNNDALTTTIVGTIIATLIAAYILEILKHIN